MSQAPSPDWTTPTSVLADWLQEARDAGLRNADAMALATATPAGDPSVRFVLLRGLDDEGLIFYTSYDSPKADELDANARGAVVFYWIDLGRQVRVSGPVERVAEQVSVDYFSRRPRGHQLAAWASEQSSPVSDEQELARRFAEAEERFAGQDVPLPPFWGGYRLRPERFEFWQERESRRHHRVQVDRRGDGWLPTLLQP